MDPNANLEEMRRLAAKLLAQYDGPSAEVNDPGDLGRVDPHDAARLVELVQALDEWLSKAGALPEAWRGASSQLTVTIRGAMPAFDPDQVAREVAKATEARLAPLVGRTLAPSHEDLAETLHAIRSMPLVEAFSDPDQDINGADAVDALGEIRDVLDAALGTPPRPAG